MKSFGFLGNWIVLKLLESIIFLSFSEMCGVCALYVEMYENLLYGHVEASV